MPFTEAASFLSSIQELPVSEDAAERPYLDDKANSSEKKKWIMKAVRSPGPSGVRSWLFDRWSGFLDLLKVMHTFPLLFSL
jgi:hydroxymethylglutaryl-CoA reductase (NADPH)